MGYLHSLQEVLDGEIDKYYIVLAKCAGTS